MIGYIIKRILWMPVVLWFVVTLVFLLTHMVPGSAVRILLGPNAGEAEIQRVIHEYALDKPIWNQYLIYMGRLLHGDMGRSIVTGRSVTKDFAIFFPATVELVVASLTLIVVIGVPLGIASAIYKNSIIDFLARAVAVVGPSIPQFWLGLMLVILFFYLLHVLPAGGRISSDINLRHLTGIYILDSLFTGNWPAFRSALSHIILPSFTLALTNLATITRLTRSSMLNTLKELYITTARACGFRESKIILTYALKNALTPIVTVIGLTAGYLMGGAFLVETVFDWPGIGLYSAQSIVNVDYAPVAGVALLTSLIYVIINFIVDMIYTLIDPRIRY